MVTEEKTRAAWKLIVAVVVGVAVVGLVVFLLVGNLLQETADDTVDGVAGNTAPGVTDVEEGKVPQDVYDDVQQGVAKDELQTQLLPALPVDNQVLARYQDRSPETIGSECVYYEAAGGSPDDLYRFCFVEDELVDKTVVFPDGDGSTG